MQFFSKDVFFKIYYNPLSYIDFFIVLFKTKSSQIFVNVFDHSSVRCIEFSI